MDEHAVIKTLVMQDEGKQPLIVLMHGDREVSTKNLARQIGAKAVEPCDPVVAERHTGYQVGGTSPFGTRKALPIYVERSILELPRIHINGGRRGFLVAMAPADLVRVLRQRPLTRRSRVPTPERCDGMSLNLRRAERPRTAESAIPRGPLG